MLLVPAILISYPGPPVMVRSGIVTIMCCCIIIIYSYSDNGCSCRHESGRLEDWKMGSPSGYGAKAAAILL